MKRKSIKWKIFAYLLFFTACLLVILWLFQIVYLDAFYESIKKNELSKATESIADYIDSDDIETVITSIARTYDVCVSVKDVDGNDIYSEETVPNCAIHKLTYVQFIEYYQQAIEAGGYITIEYESGIDMQPMEDGIPRPKDNESTFAYGAEHESIDRMLNVKGGGAYKSVVSIDVITTKTGEERVIMVNCQISPVDATVKTLIIQLEYVSVIMIILAIAIALLVAKKVSKSIIRVNNSAKELAKGRFDIVFDGNDYKEIAELSDTLNYTASELAKTENYQRELIANVSHDLRTPLTMIIAYSEIMRDLPGENTPENVQIVIDESKRLSSLVNDMLDMSKLQAGVIQMNMKEYNLTKSIESVLDRYGKLREQEGYIVEFVYSEEIMVTADEDKMYQVIYNLINNAINYTGRDKKVVVRQIVKGNIVRIEVKDSGVGIAKDELPYIWERYYKVDKTHRRAVAGTGLGLSIVKNILKLHNAKYGVDSVVDKGSVFWFELKVNVVKNIP